MSLNQLIADLESNPSDEFLRNSITEVIEYLKESLRPCYCCSQQGKYGCSSGCQCSRPALDICRNCGHLNKEHLSDGRCLGRWNSSDGRSGCPCQEFMLPRIPGD